MNEFWSRAKTASAGDLVRMAMLFIMAHSTLDAVNLSAFDYG